MLRLHRSLPCPERNNVRTRRRREKIAVNVIQLLPHVMGTPRQQQTLDQFLLHLLARVTQLTQAEIALLKAFLQLILIKPDDLFASMPIMQADKRVNPIKPCVYVERHHTPHYFCKMLQMLMIIVCIVKHFLRIYLISKNN